ncbi:Ovochymase-1 [Sciurus carolinensis]|uniref:Ovochymase-1 n=1 Tax=Sciurus carolinensis TaxID=30640 RepID=A0AA41MLG7_SCICA|nr:Ovochymase-1 [Sciurus carolinensis]
MKKLEYLVPTGSSLLKTKTLQEVLIMVLSQVSLKLGECHICGGSLIEDDRVVTAAHCLSSLDGQQLKNLTVTNGEYNLFQKEKQEQNIPVSKIVIHLEFNRLGYMSFDIVLLYLKHKIKFGIAVQSICLPHRADQFEAGILCMASGWGKITENSEDSNVLQEGELPIMDDRMCTSVLKSMNPSPLGRTLLCAIFPDRGNDACQGDSGGSLVCRKPDGIWTLTGIISWVACCERGLASPKTKYTRALPGIFSKVFELMDFITQNMITGKVCGDMLPSPLLTETNQAVVTFVSDAENSGSGFELCFTAVQKLRAGSGCGSEAALVEEGTIHCASYPRLYPSNVWCHWFIHAPEKHIVKKHAKCGEYFRIFEWLKGSAQRKEKMVTMNKFGASAEGICGIPPFSPQWLSRRIAGGEEACPHCWPWQVGLKFLGDHQCGGAIINPIWILTAAHCVQSKDNPPSWTVVAGDHDRTLKESTEQVRRAKHIIVHEDFDTVTYDSDIALIQLSSPLEYNSVVRPVCLPHSTEPLFSSEICAVTGWGSTSKDGDLASRLQQIQVTVLERAVCEGTYYSAHPGGITDRMICAGSAVSGRKDFCQGDSGGPLVCRHENGPFVLYGIVSWGAGCIQPWKPGVFARVRVFLDWIKSKIKGPTSLQTKNKSKTLRKQLSTSTLSKDSTSGPASKVKLEEPRALFSNPRYPLHYRRKLEYPWALRVAKFPVVCLSLLGSHVCRDLVMTIYEESHIERRMAGNCY